MKCIWPLVQHIRECSVTPTRSGQVQIDLDAFPDEFSNQNVSRLISAFSLVEIYQCKKRHACEKSKEMMNTLSRDFTQTSRNISSAIHKESLDYYYLYSSDNCWIFRKDLAKQIPRISPTKSWYSNCLVITLTGRPIVVLLHRMRETVQRPMMERVCSAWAE